MTMMMMGVAVVVMTIMMMIHLWRLAISEQASSSLCNTKRPHQTRRKIPIFVKDYVNRTRERGCVTTFIMLTTRSWKVKVLLRRRRSKHRVQRSSTCCRHPRRSSRSLPEHCGRCNRCQSEPGTCCTFERSGHNWPSTENAIDRLFEDTCQQTITESASIVLVHLMKKYSGF